MHCNIIIPCFNGGGLLNNNLPKLFDYINKSDNKFEIYVVNDGSKDNTLEILNAFKNNITVLSYEKNLGKGGAINYGILNCKKCDVIIYMDCDFSTDLIAIDKCLEEINNGYDAIVGSRFLKDSVLPVKRTLIRRITSKCCNILINTLFHFNLKDTQCGFKCFKYSLATKAAMKQVIFGWAFDVEYLLYAKLNNYKLKEIPVYWTENFDTQLKILSSSYKFFVSIFKIKRRKRSYHDKK